MMKLASQYSGAINLNLHLWRKECMLPMSITTIDLILFLQ